MARRPGKYMGRKVYGTTAGRGVDEGRRKRKGMEGFFHNGMAVHA